MLKVALKLNRYFCRRQRLRLLLLLHLLLPPALLSTLDADVRDIRKCSNATAHEATATQNKEKATPTATNSLAKILELKIQK